MCHPKAQCLFNGTVGQYQCACTAGYEGDGFDCVEPGWYSIFYQNSIHNTRILNIIMKWLKR